MHEDLGARWRRVSSAIKAIDGVARQHRRSASAADRARRRAVGARTSRRRVTRGRRRAPTHGLAKSFEPHAIERRWYPRWEARGYFKADRRPVGRAYCIQLPPPNVTGTLHMGHAFQQTLMDALIRYHRMRGDNDAVAVGHRPRRHRDPDRGRAPARRAEGKTRHDLGREEFVERVWEWKQQSGSTITRQMRRLGASCDWVPRERYFTMDAECRAP